MLTCSSDALFFDLALESRERFYCCLPGITGPKAEALIEAQKRHLNVRVVVDASESIERHGYGEISAVAKLKEMGVEVRELPKNAVGLLVSDAEGYLFFSLSAHLYREGSGFNTLRIDGILLERLVHALFPARTQAEKAKEAQDWEAALTADAQDLRDFSIQMPEEEHAPTKPLNEEQLEDARASLRSKPVVHPDLQRTMEVYTRKVQFAELVFKGGSFTDRVVSLPSELLGGLPEDLRKRTRTTFRLFGDEESLKALEPLAVFAQHVEDLRSKLRYVPSRRKHVLQTSMREDFEASAARLNAMIPEVAREIRQGLQNAIDRTAKRVYDELFRLHEDAFRQSGGWFADDPEAARHYAAHKSGASMSTLSFPAPIDLLQRMEIRWYFYDLTWEDFSDAALLRELSDCGLIRTMDADHLRELTAAVAGTRQR